MSHSWPYQLFTYFAPNFRRPSKDSSVSEIKSIQVTDKVTPCPFSSARALAPQRPKTLQQGQIIIDYSLRIHTSNSYQAQPTKLRGKHSSEDKSWQSTSVFQPCLKQKTKTKRCFTAPALFSYFPVWRPFSFLLHGGGSMSRKFWSGVEYTNHS